MATTEVQQQNTSNQGVLGDPIFQVLSSNAGSNFLSPASGQPVIPSNEELNALALLSKFDEDGIIRDVAKKDLAFVRAASRLLAKDPFLRQQLGGAGFRSVLRLSGMMKLQFNDWIMKLRTAKMLPMMLEDLGFNSVESIALITGTGGDVLKSSMNDTVVGLTKSAARSAVESSTDPLQAVGKSIHTAFSGDNNYNSLLAGPRTGITSYFTSQVDDADKAGGTYGLWSGLL